MRGDKGFTPSIPDSAKMFGIPQPQLMWHCLVSVLLISVMLGKDVLTKTHEVCSKLVPRSECYFICVPASSALQHTIIETDLPPPEGSCGFDETALCTAKFCPVLFEYKIATELLKDAVMLLDKAV